MSRIYLLLIREKSEKEYSDEEIDKEIETKTKMILNTCEKHVDLLRSDPFYFCRSLIIPTNGSLRLFNSPKHYKKMNTDRILYGKLIGTVDIKRKILRLPPTPMQMMMRPSIFSLVFQDQYKKFPCPTLSPTDENKLSQNWKFDGSTTILS